MGSALGETIDADLDQLTVIPELGECNLEGQRVGFLGIEPSVTLLDGTQGSARFPVSDHAEPVCAWTALNQDTV